MLVEPLKNIYFEPNPWNEYIKTSFVQYTYIIHIERFILSADLTSNAKIPWEVLFTSWTSEYVNITRFRRQWKKGFCSLILKDKKLKITEKSMSLWSHALVSKFLWVCTTRLHILIHLLQKAGSKGGGGGGPPPKKKKSP